jgi:hypothetical protein
MPPLSTAEQILIVTVAEDQGLSDEEGSRLLTSLRRHGFNVSMRRLPPGTQGAASTLLAAAAEQAALVVMGAMGTAGCVNGSSAASPDMSCGVPRCRC